MEVSELNDIALQPESETLEFKKSTAQLERIVELCIQAGLPEPQFFEQAGSFVVRFLSDEYIPQYKISQKLSQRQLKIFQLLSKAPETFSIIKSKISNPPKDRTLRDDFQYLKHLGLIEVKGRGKGAVWFIIRNKAE